MTGFPAIPRLPTDNLYKFVALTGLLLFVMGWVGPVIAINRVDALARDAQRDVALLDLRSQADSLGMDILLAEEQRDTSRAHKRRVDSLRVRTDSTRREIILARAEADAVKDAFQWLEIYRVVGIFLTVAGSVLAWWGFWLWYTRLQRPLDEWVKKHGTPPAGEE